MLAFKDQERPPAFYVAGLIGGLLLGGWATAGSFGAAREAGGAMAAAGTALGGAWALLLGGLLHAGFVAKSVAELIGEMGRRGRGDHQLVVKKTFDQAEAAEKKRDWGTAERLYREEADKDPADGDVRARLAEVLHKQGRTEEAARVLAEAIPLIDEPEKKAPLAFRLSEIHVKAGQKDSAKAVLQSAVEALAGTRYEAFARKRLEGLGQ